LGANTYHFYYDAAWQRLELRMNGNTAPTQQYVWSPVYVNAMIERDRDPTGGTNLTERLYVAQDANWNVTSVFDTSGTVQERYVYDPYGQITYYAVDANGNWTTSGGTSFAWGQGWQGLFFDNSLQIAFSNARWWNFSEGRWISADPAGYIDGTNYYLGEGDN